MFHCLIRESREAVQRCWPFGETMIEFMPAQCYIQSIVRQLLSYLLLKGGCIVSIPESFLAGKQT